MRLDASIIRFFKRTIKEEIPEARVYLFGSRTNDDALGGDVDLLVLTHNIVDKRIFRTIRIEFYKEFGWQKVDLINFTYDDHPIFRQLIDLNAVEL